MHQVREVILSIWGYWIIYQNEVITHMSKKKKKGEREKERRRRRRRMKWIYLPIDGSYDEYFFMLIVSWIIQSTRQDVFILQLLQILAFVNILIYFFKTKIITLASDIIKNILYYFYISPSVLESFVYAIVNFITNREERVMFRYHIPRTWVHPGENLLVRHEELGGDPSKISLLTRTSQDIYAHVSEADPPPADSWKPNPEIWINYEQGWHISMINFASFGTPSGNCGTFCPGICHVNVTSIVQQVKKLLLVHV